jgi:hypothetical protein
MHKKGWIASCIVLGVALATLALFTVVIARAGPLAQGSAAPGAGVSGQDTLGTGFTYQGQLQSGGQPVNETCDMAFRLYDQATGGMQVGSAITTSVPITDGFFTVGLDFGPAFAGDARWLEVRVKCPGDANYADLGREELTAAPYALHSQSASALHGYPITTTAPATGQALMWDGGAWAPSDDVNIVYTSGFGLELNGYQFSAVTSTLQARVGGPCAVGNSIRAIHADGTVECEPHNPRPGFSLTTIDSAGSPGVDSSIAIGVDGLGLIAHRNDAGAGDLRVSHCNDLACTSATTTDLGGSCTYPSIAIGADGLGLVSSICNASLKVAHCNDVACTSATVSTIASTSQAEGTSVSIGVDGLGLISYSDNGNGTLKVAHCDNITCTTATVTTLDTGGAQFTSLTIGADGLGLISYNNNAGLNSDLMAAHCSDITCTSAITTTLDGASPTGSYSSVTIGSDGLGLISYYDGSSTALKVAHCDNVGCTGANTTTVDTGGTNNVGYFTSITIGSDGLGLIVYFDLTARDLKAAHCSNVACTSSTITTVDSAGDVGWYNSVTVGTDGMPLISYRDADTPGLRVAHCSNVFCMPYFQRR